MSNQIKNRQSAIENRFIEIVDWEKEQPRMADGPNEWCKLYASLLDHDGFESLDDASRVLIMMLKMYSTRSGRHIFPADPTWIWKRIPFLNSLPDLAPLMNTVDVFGNPAPFVRYCPAPEPEGQEEMAKAKKPGKKPAAKKAKTKTKKEEKREERREEKREDEILSDFEKRKEREKTRVSTEADETKRQAADRTVAEKPEKPVNPNDSEAGAAEAHIVPKPPQSAYRGPQAIGAIISRRFPDHWQDPDAEAFGWQMVEALGYSTDRDNIHSRAEAGMFAKWWWKIKKSCPVIVLDELRATAIRKALFVNSPKCKSARNKSKVWNHIMKGELGQGSGKQARASP